MSNPEPLEKPNDFAEGVIRGFLVNDQFYEMSYTANRAVFNEKDRLKEFDSLVFLHARPYKNKPTPAPQPRPTPTPPKRSFLPQWI